MIIKQKDTEFYVTPTFSEIHHDVNHNLFHYFTYSDFITCSFTYNYFNVLHKSNNCNIYRKSLISLITNEKDLVYNNMNIRLYVYTTF